MEAFFAKYPVTLGEDAAIEMIHQKIECALEEIKEDKESDAYLKYLAVAYAMIEDFCEEKNIDLEAWLT